MQTILANSTNVKIPATADVQSMNTHLWSLSFLAAEYSVDSAGLFRDAFLSIKLGFLFLAPPGEESSDVL